MALTLLAANNAQTVLAAGISSSATSLTVNTGTGSLFPSPVAGSSFFKLTIIDAATGSLTEIIHVTARSGDVFTIQRGQEGTTARAWSANDIVANMMTAGTLSYILGNFQPLDPTLTALAALVGVANKLPYFNGDDTAALTDLTQVGRDIIGKNAVDDVLTYLGLGEAAKRDVGTGTNQIPDMSKWTSLKADYGWRLTPDGFLEQWGRGNYGNGDGDFVIPFPNRCVFVLISSDPNDTSYAEISQAFPVSNSKFRVGCATAEGNNVNPANLTCNWYAKGW